MAAKSKKRRSAEQAALDKLRRHNARLEADLTKTKTALGITGKVHALLEQLSESADTEPPPPTMLAQVPVGEQSMVAKMIGDAIAALHSHSSLSHQIAISVR